MSLTTIRSTCWSLTINNPTKDDVEQINLARQRGWKVEGQLEKGLEGTQHYQLRLMTPQVRFSSVKKAFPRAHIEVARDPIALGKYVTKEATKALVERAIAEKLIGSNADIFVERLKANARYRKAADELNEFDKKSEKELALKDKDISLKDRQAEKKLLLEEKKIQSNEKIKEKEVAVKKIAARKKPSTSK